MADVQDSVQDGPVGLGEQPKGTGRDVPHEVARAAVMSQREKGMASLARLAAAVNSELEVLKDESDIFLSNIRSAYAFITGHIDVVSKLNDRK